MVEKTIQATTVASRVFQTTISLMLTMLKVSQIKPTHWHMKEKKLNSK
jgi:hypothetical protein